MIVNAEPPSLATLAGVDVILISNPSAKAVGEGPEPPQFSPEAIATLREFVYQGGGLILMGKQVGTGTSLLMSGADSVSELLSPNHASIRSPNRPAWAFDVDEQRRVMAVTLGSARRITPHLLPGICGVIRRWCLKHGKYDTVPYYVRDTRVCETRSWEFSNN